MITDGQDVSGSLRCAQRNSTLSSLHVVPCVAESWKELSSGQYAAEIRPDKEPVSPDDLALPSSAVVDL